MLDGCRHHHAAAASGHAWRWLAGYQVVIAQVVGSYGDGGIPHPLAGVTLPVPGRAEPGR